ncbi:MAG: cytochrome c3 family protein [Bacteroidales bacterium]|jgi:predicted CXXCH cytochrome family protein|nr:cytochrome c3 family protein [Bacteroidales bacterium]
MKTRNIIISSLVLLFFTQISIAQITGTAHDFSSETWAPSENRMCGVCHATHNAMNEPSAPLWNHESTAVAGYTLYSSPTFDNHGGTTITDPSASSKLCLSCHDGTVALENFGGITTGTTYITGDTRIGGVAGNDLSREHPISFEYTDALAAADGGLYAPSSSNSGLGGTIDQDMLFNNKMECASCHDVHNKYGVTHLLKISNINSELCLTCHNK